MVRDEKTGEWNGPAFYALGGASYGPQIGGEVSQTVFLVMTQRGISSFLSNSFKLGADVGVAVGPVGIGASAATANLSADILSFSRSRGLYAGASLSGAVIAVRDIWNRAYYGKRTTTTDILIRREVFNPEARKLVEELEKMTVPSREGGQRL
jgi:lipid-binding SYLF domain-containing protein